MSSLRRLLVVGLLLSAGVLVGSLSAVGSPPSPRAVGSASGGDPYFPKDGNGGYDVRHYTIQDRYRPGTDQLRGRTALRARSSVALTRFHLDLVLTPDRVTVDGRRARFSKPDRHTLRIDPATPVPAGETFRVVVDYHGRPASVRAVGAEPGVDLFFHEPGETVAMGEPRNAPWWFAANEIPSDKATYDIVLRVPRGDQAVSNGELVSRTRAGEWTRWHWAMDEPMTTYLAFFAAGRFALERGTVDGHPFTYAVSRRIGAPHRGWWFDRLRGTDDVVAALEEWAGPYPFTSIGGVATSLDSGYALEAQSRPVYPGGGGVAVETLVVHETAHQWFGNDVSLRRWRDIWLNEGFATFAEWRYAEQKGGRTTTQQLAREYNSRPAQSAFWALQVSDPGPDSMFAEPVYKRGAMTLAALRDRVGAADFDALVLEWVERNHEGHATTSDFRSLAEDVTGEDLDAFFTEWLDDTDRPGAEWLG